MVRIEIYAPSVCDFTHIEKGGYMQLEDNISLKEVLKIIKLPILWRKFSYITVNSDKVSSDYIMKDGDVLSIFMPVVGG